MSIFGWTFITSFVLYNLGYMGGGIPTALLLVFTFILELGYNKDTIQLTKK